MNKILLIIKREYLTRVRKKTFIISTILFPLLYLALIFGMAYLGETTRANLNVAVIDSSGYFDRGMFERANQADSSARLTLVKMPESELSQNYKKEGFDGFIVIPAQVNWESGFDNLYFRSDKKFGSSSVALVQSKLNAIWTDIKNEKLGIDENKKSIIANSKIIVRGGDLQGKAANEGVATTIGYVAGFLIYFILLVYGSQVMMGVMEEKTNRIAEVIVSSIRPFQLMLGKIIGIGLVALTQFFIWIVFMLVVYNIGKAGSNAGMMSSVLGNVQEVFTGINVTLILFCFGFYFLGGFFFYASLYAAIGSAVNEDMREAQSLSFPITLLVIFSIALMTTAINNPTGPIAVWASIIPFSSPIVMMARIPFGVPGTVPWWQLGLSMGLLVTGFIFSVWLSGKIYRTGILMYGKKPSWKEMIKWAMKRS
ncbi:MAG TPA: ABC transporter permease [Chitinophagaceae bacterium]|nr:ABC transporter permease [Chitinophagaceae bacterium]